MFPTTLEHPYVSRGRRRGRNDPNSRDYICPCGKSYLSYPALFTHIKIKHNGRAPGQIIKPRSQNASRRGRPRAKQVYDSESDTQDIAANCIDRLCDFVTDIQKWDDNGKLKQIYMKDDFYSIYLNYNPQQQQPRYDQNQQLYEQTCDNVFCQVLAQVNKRLNQPYYVDALMMFFAMLARCINQNQQTQKFQYGMIDQEESNQQQDQNFQEQKQESQEVQKGQENINANANANTNANKNHNPNLNLNVMSVKKMNQDSSHSQQQRQNGLQQGYDNFNKKIQQNNFNQQIQELKYDDQMQDQKFSMLRVKHQNIIKIVNYINGFMNNSFPKYLREYGLQTVPLFNSKNIKKLIEHFFHWLTMRKYLCYKLKINPNFNQEIIQKQV